MKTKEFVIGYSGRVNMKNFEHVNIYHSEVVEFEEGDNLRKSKRIVKDRVKAFVEDELEELRAIAAKRKITKED